ncbi:hypothetical protein EMCRGX_G015737 [Ephydatia muelleri]
MMAQLEEKELKYLIGTLRLVSHKWRHLAIQLEVQEVDIIEKNHPHDVERCLEDTLKRWLKSDKSNAEILVSALVTIGEIGHAEEIRKKYNCQNELIPPSPKVPKADKHRLQPSDSDDLFRVIGSAHPQWRNIGRALGFKHNELSAIVPRGGLTSQRDYFEEMLVVWLKWAPPKAPYPTTEALVAALQTESAPLRGGAYNTNSRRVRYLTIEAKLKAYGEGNRVVLRHRWVVDQRVNQLQMASMY